MSSINVYYCEGKTESVLVDKLKVERLIPAGKTKVANIWNVDIQRKFGIFLKRNVDNVAHVVFDTDDVNSHDIVKIERFVGNILYLSKNCKHVCLLPQSLNFEDELTYACGLNANRHLFSAMYDISSKNEFKSTFISDSKPLEVLRKAGFDFEKLWKRDESLRSILKNRRFPNNVSVFLP